MEQRSLQLLRAIAALLTVTLQSHPHLLQVLLHQHVQLHTQSLARSQLHLPQVAPADRQQTTHSHSLQVLSRLEKQHRQLPLQRQALKLMVYRTLRSPPAHPQIFPLPLAQLRAQFAKLLVAKFRF